MRPCSGFARSRGFTAVPGDPTRRADHNGLVDVDAFIRDGYVVIRGAFGADTAAARRAGIEPRRWPAVASAAWMSWGGSDARARHRPGHRVSQRGTDPRGWSAVWCAS
jgi:hypothetical protein